MKSSLPESSSDLLIKDPKILMRSCGVYEILKRFSHLIRLTPFRFEDFNAVLLAQDQSPLLAEIHIQLLKTLIREDRIQQTWLGPSDIRDSVNIYLHLADHITWPAALRIYLSADSELNSNILGQLKNQYKNYPLDVNIQVKLDVLEHLCDQFLLSNLSRDEIVNGRSAITKYDTTCRLCSKPMGPFLMCSLCPAVYHFKCSDPPFEEPPEDPYECSICRSNQVIGVTDCLTEDEINGNLKRHEAIGIDKQFKTYWFIVRRLFVVDEEEHDIRYYTDKEGLDNVVSFLKESRNDKNLIANLQSQYDEIVRQMNITQDLYKNLPDEFKNEEGKYIKFLGQNGIHKEYVNHYSSNLAISKNQNSDRESNRSLANKFCINNGTSFRWNGAIDGHSMMMTATIKSTFIKFEASLPPTFVHPCWVAQQKNVWIKNVNLASEPKDYNKALCILETCIKPVLFKQAWFDSVGFTQLFRSTFLEREEMKKTERQPRGFERREWFVADIEFSREMGTLIKFAPKTKPIKHQVWKQKGEEYRITGLNAWCWRSATHHPRLRSKSQPFGSIPCQQLPLLYDHPSIIDHINNLLKSSDVVDVSKHLAAADKDRYLYPRRPVYPSAKKEEQVRNLEKILIEKQRLGEKKKLDDSKLSTNNKLINNPQDNTSQRDKQQDSKDLKQAGGGVDDGIKTTTTTRPSIPDISKPVVVNNVVQVKNQMTTTPVANGIKLDMLKKCIIARPKMPPTHDFCTKRTRRKSILILPELELRKLARSGGLRETKSFNYTAKQNHHVWPYGQTPRPTFRTCWLYRNQLIDNMQDVAIQLKVLHGCLRWDDIAIRPPASGKNTILTDESTITIQLLRKRDRLPYLIHSEYLIRKTMTPIEQPTKYRKLTNKVAKPSARSGLRARRQTEEEEPKGPTVEEVWVPEEQLELWELRQFDEEIERQNRLLRERAMREENEKKRRLEEERRRQLDLERRKRMQEEEERRRARLAKSAPVTPIILPPATPGLNSTPGLAPTTPLRVGQPGNLVNPNGTPTQRPITPTTPVLRYFRTEQGQIIRLPASYLQRGTPLILRHVGPGSNQTNTYIIRPQITNTNIVLTQNDNNGKAQSVGTVKNELAHDSPAAQAQAQAQAPTHSQAQTTNTTSTTTTVTNATVCSSASDTTATTAAMSTDSTLTTTTTAMSVATSASAMNETSAPTSAPTSVETAATSVTGTSPQTETSDTAPSTALPTTSDASDATTASSPTRVKAEKQTFLV